MKQVLLTSGAGYIGIEVFVALVRSGVLVNLAMADHECGPGQVNH